MRSEVILGRHLRIRNCQRSTHAVLVLRILWCLFVLVENSLLLRLMWWLQALGMENERC